VKSASRAKPRSPYLAATRFIARAVTNAIAVGYFSLAPIPSPVVMREP
jgi:hypothetical protein